MMTTTRTKMVKYQEGTFYCYLHNRRSVCQVILWKSKKELLLLCFMVLNSDCFFENFLQEILLSQFLPHMIE